MDLFRKKQIWFVCACEFMILLNLKISFVLREVVILLTKPSYGCCLLWQRQHLLDAIHILCIEYGSLQTNEYRQYNSLDKKNHSQKNKSEAKKTLSAIISTGCWTYGVPVMNSFRKTETLYRDFMKKTTCFYRICVHKIMKL